MPWATQDIDRIQSYTNNIYTTIFIIGLLLKHNNSVEKKSFEPQAVSFLVHKLHKTLIGQIESSHRAF